LFLVEGGGVMVAGGPVGKEVVGWGLGGGGGGKLLIGK